jgi:hypothetical protein
LRPASEEPADWPFVFFAEGKNAMDNPTKKEQPDRSKINMHEVHELKYWAKELGVSKEKLREAVNIGGNNTDFAQNG